MSTKNSRRTNAPTGFAELAKRMNLTYQPAEKPSMQLIRPFPGAGRIVPSPPCVLSPTVPHRVRAASPAPWDTPGEFRIKTAATNASTY